MRATVQQVTVWRYTLDHTPAFYAAADVMCGELRCNIVDFLGCSNAESGVSAKACNPVSRASGLIQLMPANMPGVGWTQGDEAFRALTATAQLPYVRRYFARFIGKLTSSAVLYTAVFLPAFVDQAAKDDDYVLCAKKSSGIEKLGWAYAANAIFDENGDGRITVRELQRAIERNATGPRWSEIVRRSGAHHVPEWATPNPTDLRTTFGIQSKLLLLGYDLGPSGADGVPGALTRRAVMKFQEERGLARDGIVGPKTRMKLEAA